MKLSSGKRAVMKVKLSSGKCARVMKLDLVAASVSPRSGSGSGKSGVLESTCKST